MEKKSCNKEIYMTEEGEKKNNIGPVAEEYRGYLRKRKSELGKFPPKEERVAAQKRLRKELGEPKNDLKNLMAEIRATGFRSNVVERKANAFDQNSEVMVDADAVDRALSIRTELHGAIEQSNNFSDIQKVVALAMSDILLEQDAAEISRASLLTVQYVANYNQRDTLPETEFFRTQCADFEKRAGSIKTKDTWNGQWIDDNQIRRQIRFAWGDYRPETETTDIQTAFECLFLKGVASTQGSETPTLLRRDFLSLIRQCAVNPAIAKHIFTVVPTVGQLDAFAVRVTKKFGRHHSSIHLFNDCVYLPDGAWPNLSNARIEDIKYFSRIFPPIQRHLAWRVLHESGTKRELFQELFELNHTIKQLWKKVQSINSVKSLVDRRYRENCENDRREYDDAVGRREAVYKQLQSMHPRPVTKTILDSMADEQAIYRPGASQKIDPPSFSPREQGDGK